jgi:hypothetical protein
MRSSCVPRPTSAAAPSSTQPHQPQPSPVPCNPAAIAPHAHTRYRLNTHSRRLILSALPRAQYEKRPQRCRTQKNNGPLTLQQAAPSFARSFCVSAAILSSWPCTRSQSSGSTLRTGIPRVRLSAPPACPPRCWRSSPLGARCDIETARPSGAVGPRADIEARTGRATGRGRARRASLPLMASWPTAATTGRAALAGSCAASTMTLAALGAVPVAAGCCHTARGVAAASATVGSCRTGATTMPWGTGCAAGSVRPGSDRLCGRFGAAGRAADGSAGAAAAGWAALAPPSARCRAPSSACDESTGAMGRSDGSRALGGAVGGLSRATSGRSAADKASARPHSCDSATETARTPCRPCAVEVARTVHASRPARARCSTR